jgi:uncharacterized heparinase superfamily protein
MRRMPNTSMIFDSRFWRTVRHLKAEQIYRRVWFSLNKPTPDLRAPPPRRAASGHWVLPAMRAPSLDEAGRVTFLNESRELGDCGWDDPSIEHLWRYNLHYFDDLNARDAAHRSAVQRTLIERWIAANPAGRGVGWEPYPTSLRLVNWIKWFNAGTTPVSEWQASLAVQARWLRGRLEFHLLGNHLFVNAKALIFAGLFFTGEEADAWLREGLRILARELPEQILPDGGQFELSPMYHALALEDLLDLINMLLLHPRTDGDQFLPRLRDRAKDMLFWQRCMLHPDGRIASFNDAADGIAPPDAELERYARALGVIASEPPAAGVTHLCDSGYVRVARARMVALLDVAPVGPDYLPAHAHADTLSFELSLGTRRVLVNGGTSVYGSSERRTLERGTAAHNTVEVAGRDSSEVWSGFRVGRRARPETPHFEPDRIRCAHDGYRFLPGAPRHQRTWQFGDGTLRVFDEVTGDLPAVARYHLAPGLRFERVSDATFKVIDEQEAIATMTVARGMAGVVAATHAAAFNQVIPTECLEVRLVERCSEVSMRWSA